MASSSGADIIAQALGSLGVTVIFGLVGIPVIDIAERALDGGIRFLGFRNEQAAVYAAGAYGYLTGRPGVCLVVGGPGVLHAMAGVGNATANAFPILLLAGSADTGQVTRGAFQELDAVALLTPHTKTAIRPPEIGAIPDAIRNAYRTCWYGRPGAGFVDLPADLIEGSVQGKDVTATGAGRLAEPPRGAADGQKIARIAQKLRTAKAPLVVIGKGAAFAQAETSIRRLIDHARLFFLPTPMGKGVVSDSHALNAASARSAALKEADVVLLLGARLNWILHFGDSPKWNPEARFIQVDLSAEEIGRNSADAELGIVGDIATVVPQLTQELGSWTYNTSSAFARSLSAAKARNEAAAASKAASANVPMSFSHAFNVIQRTLHHLSPPDEGGIVYVSEGSNTMDISRSIFPVSHPRLRLDAGTYAAMGVGLGYAIAAHAAYNSSDANDSSSVASRKKIVALEGDSAFGFSAMEVETMARYGMDILIFVMNNGGIYHGDSDDARGWLALQARTRQGASEGALRSTSLGWEVGYEKIAEMCGGTGYLVRTPGELERATREGFRDGKVCVVNVLIESGKESALQFGWQQASKGKKQASKL